ncbi:hypothetical protein GW17_00054645 [Ensete ventricosum]|nr:hypothetical protein GW17_00054645 [Ensete ventricosum]RZS08662.1 hypothetical protein BHM03_00039656 [Ensete ventricosum]
MLAVETQKGFLCSFFHTYYARSLILYILLFYRCYICLADYEDGDVVRILPCHHEYHMACVDKWLKEIHGYLLIFSVFLNVCPLCRGDVTEAVTGSFISNS